MTPEIHGQGVTSHLRCSGTSNSQIRMLGGEKDRGVFGEHADAESEPDGEPPGAAAGLMELGEREQQKRRGDDHRIIRRRQH